MNESNLLRKIDTSKSCGISCLCLSVYFLVIVGGERGERR